MGTSTRVIDGVELSAGQTWMDAWGCIRTNVWATGDVEADHATALDAMALFGAEREQKTGETWPAAVARVRAALVGFVVVDDSEACQLVPGRTTWREVLFPVEDAHYEMGGCRLCEAGETQEHQYER